MLDDIERAVRILCDSDELTEPQIIALEMYSAGIPVETICEKTGKTALNIHRSLHTGMRRISDSVKEGG